MRRRGKLRISGFQTGTTTHCFNTTEQFHLYLLGTYLVYLDREVIGKSYKSRCFSTPSMDRREVLSQNIYFDYYNEWLHIYVNNIRIAITIVWGNI